jgi:hypothetical protein
MPLDVVVNTLVAHRDGFLAGGWDQGPAIFTFDTLGSFSTTVLPYQPRDVDPPAYLAVHALAAHEDVVVAIGQAEGGAGTRWLVEWLSPDGGDTWEQLRENALTQEAYLVRDMAAGGGAVVVATHGAAIGSGALWASRDGQSWTIALPPDAPLEVLGVSHDGARFLAVGRRYDGASGSSWSPAAWVSPDGFAWSEDTPLSDGTMVDVAADASGSAVAVGCSGEPHDPTKTGDARWWSDSRASSWTAAIVGPPDQCLRSVAAVDGGWVALATGTGGVSWWTATADSDWREDDVAPDVAHRSTLAVNEGSVLAVYEVPDPGGFESQYQLLVGTLNAP